jgi:hypothetical protein
MSDPFKNITDSRFDNWAKSSYSQGDGGCVEWSPTPTAVGIADSKAGTTAPILVVTPTAWQAFVCNVKSGLISA